MQQKSKVHKKRIVTALIIATLITVAVSIFLWHIHRQQLRSDMENHLVSSILYIENRIYQPALTEAKEAETLANRLRDGDSLHTITAQIRLIEEMIHAQELFDAGAYYYSRNAYLQALSYSANIIKLDPGFIHDSLEIVDEYIYFYELIESAEALIGQRDYLSAQILFEMALSIAEKLAYVNGILLSEEGISRAKELFFLARRSEARLIASLGETSFLSSNYTEAIEYFQLSLEILKEIGDTESIEIIKTRIEAAERKIAELEQAAIAAAEAAIRATAESEAAALALQAEQGSLQADQTIDAVPNPTANQQSAADLNYQHNRIIDFDLTTLIDDQNQSPANQIRMGATDGLNEGWRNGCGWIAAYNALILLGNPHHPAEIVNRIESGGGTVLGGVFGTFPHAIERLFIDKGYDVNHILFPGRSVNIDDTIRASRVSILAYTHTRAAHFITIEYRDSDGKFIVYNDSFARRRSATLGFENYADNGSAVDSITALIGETPDILFSFSLITVS